mgnify:CR=1 FL=1
MTTRNITLTAKQDALVDQMIRSGAYQTASEAIGEALLGLQQRLEQLEPRRQQLAAAVGGGEVAPQDPVELRSEQESLRQRSSELTRSQERNNQQLRELEQNQLSRQAAQEQLRGRCGQLEGSLQVLGERLQHLNSAEIVGGELEAQQQQLRALHAELEQLQSARHHGGAANPAADPAEQLEALEQEKDRLLSQLGQAQQRTQSLGAANPLAELEQRQVAWEEAEAERAALEQRGMALRLLLERFHHKELLNFIKQLLTQVLIFLLFEEQQFLPSTFQKKLLHLI